jgi:flagellar biosynthesis protein FliQ
MRCPADKALAYTAVVVVCAIVAGLVVGLLSAAITPMPRVGVAMQ